MVSPWNNVFQRPSCSFPNPPTTIQFLLPSMNTVHSPVNLQSRKGNISVREIIVEGPWPYELPSNYYKVLFVSSSDLNAPLRISPTSFQSHPWLLSMGSVGRAELVEWREEFYKDGKPSSLCIACTYAKIELFQAATNCIE